MDESVFDKKYQKYKLKVKIWEKNFKKKYGRIPSKHDIHDASNDIRYAYKMYYKLKTSLLEDTLCDVLGDELDDGFELPQSDSNLSLSDLNSTSQIPSLIVADVSFCDPKPIKVFEAEEILSVNEKAWGKHVSIEKENVKVQKDDAPQTTYVKAGLKPQLFESKSFVKRNPRKTLSRIPSTTLSTSCNSTDSPKEALPDLETILNERLLERNKSTTNLDKSSFIVEKSNSDMKLANINEKWLDRCDSMINLKSDLNCIDRGSLSMNSSGQTASFGMSGLNLNSLRSSASSFQSSNRSSLQSQSTLENSCDTSLITSDSEVIQNSDNEAEETSIFHRRKKRKLMVTQSQQNLTLNVSDGTDEIKVDILPSEVAPVAEKAQAPIVKKVVKVVKSKAPKPECPATIPKGRITRTRRNAALKVSSYTESHHSDADEYIFDGTDDEDIDADYKAGKGEIEDDESRDMATLTKKKTLPKTKTAKTRVTRGRPKQAIPTEEENDSPTTYTEYIPEFGIEQIQNVPQVDINELKKSTKLFENYLITSNSAIDTTTPGKSVNTPPVLSAKEQRLADKIKAGKLNENFVRVDIRRKKFVRGKKAFNFTKWKKTQWSKKKVAALSGPDMNMGGCDGGVLVCFQCGGVGHYAQNCKVQGDELLPLDAKNEEVSPFPTLEEAEEMAKHELAKVHGNNPSKLPAVDNPTWKEVVENEVGPAEIATVSDEKFIGHRIPDNIIEKSGILEVENFVERFKVNPLYSTNADGTIIDTPEEVFTALKMFGHKQFRAGQEKAIMRILSGVSTLVTLSTGSGKSLCYQLPAFLYAKKMKCCTLVISPLVSLMEDQVHGIPSFLNAQCLHTNQSPAVKDKITQMITAGTLDVLLISPEAVLSAENMSGFGSILKQLPPIAFACIDEVHCVSQWSHNFRPSYLMICRVLREKLGVKTILGLTATATSQTRLNIIEHIGIPDGVTGIISDIPLPDNLILSVSCDENRDAAIIELLRSERFEKCQSIIVYCIRRNECERIATYIRTCFQNVTSSTSRPPAESRKRKKSDWIAEPYHAGLASSRRKAIQNKFMRGDLKIVVATIAFGMGINKSDIRAVIHYNMPKSFESYVQEVGRAGRDGLPAQCHLFLDSKGNDQNELRRHIYANSIDRHVIRKLLQKTFVPCACSKNKDVAKASTSYFGRACPGHEIAFSIEKIVQYLDIPEQNISTILCYLELHENRYIQTLRNAYTMCKVLSYGGPRALRQAAQECPPLAMAIALDLKKGISHDASSFIEFPVIEVAAAIGWDSGVVKHQLKNLEWTKTGGYPQRSNITVTFFDLGFRVKAPGDLTDAELDATLDLLHQRVSHQEKTEMIQLQTIFDAFQKITYSSYRNVVDIEKIVDRSNTLKTIIRNYFQTEIDVHTEIKSVPDNTPDAVIKSDIRAMIQQYPENNFTGRNIARIFHGCQSPNYPAVIWGRSKYWRAHLKVDFNRIVALANSEIIELRRAGTARY